MRSGQARWYPADERRLLRWRPGGSYKKSVSAGREAEKFLDKGLRVFFVHPSTPIGPGDHKPTPTGKIIVDFLNRKMPAYIDTGLNLVDVRDVAEGHCLAIERGRPGEKYILGNRNLGLSEIFALLERFEPPRPGFVFPTVWFFAWRGILSACLVRARA